MEERFAALKIPDSEPNQLNVKLTKATSFSELPSTRRILVEQCYRGDSVNLIRQYSCEQILDQTKQISQIKFSEIMQGNNDENMKIQTNIVPYRKLKTLEWKNNSNVNIIPVPPPMPTNNQIEYMEVEDLESTNQTTFAVPTVPTSTSSTTNSKKSQSSKGSNVALAKLLLAGRKHAQQDNLDCANENEQNKNSNNSYQSMKEKIRPLVPKKEIPTKEKTKHSRVCSKMCFKMLFLILLPIFVVLISILLYQDHHHEHSINFVNAIIELRKRIHGQDRAVQALSEYLQLDMPHLKVIALVGGTGVGKSYTVEIIKKNFPRAYSVRQYFPPIEVTVSNIGLPFLFPELIILENLREHDLMDVANFLKTREKVPDHQYVTVLAVFNVEQMNDDSIRSINLNRSLETIRNFFAERNNYIKIIPYDSLSEDTLEKCIIDAAKDSGLMLSDSRIDLIKENLLVSNAGCKGAYSKVQVIGRQ